MANVDAEIVELFSVLTLKQKEDMLRKLRGMIEAERETPQKSYLEDAWTNIQRELRSLSMYPYIDDQLEIDEVWNICEDLIKSGKLEQESWKTRKRILSQIIENELYDAYGVYDPMKDLMSALCITQEEKLLCADLTFRIGSDYVRQYGAKIYKECGRPEKYYEYVEQCLGSENAPYMELIEYYKDKDTDKAAEIGQLGLKKCKEEQTDIMIFLLQHAQQTGDMVKFNRFLQGAKLRHLVNYEKVKAGLGIE